MKACTRCHIEKEDSEFRKRTDKRDGRVFLNSTCKKCDAALAKKYYDKKKNDPSFKERNILRVKRYTASNFDEIKRRRKLPEYLKKHAGWALKRYYKVKDFVAAKMKVKRQTPEYKAKMAEYRKKNKEKIYQQEVITKKRYHEKNKSLLTDKYIINLLKTQGATAITPDLIELKRVKVLKHRIKIELLKKKLHGKEND